MIQGTYIEPEDLTQTILAVVRLAQRRVTIISPVVEEVVLEVIREHAREGVEIEVRAEGRGHAQMVVADEHVALTTSTSFNSVGTGIGWVEPDEGEEPRVPNVECGLVVEGVEAVQKLLESASSFVGPTPRNGR